MCLGHVTIQTKYFAEEIGFFEKHVEMKIAHRLKGMGKNIVFLTGGEEGSNIEIIENMEAEKIELDNLSLGFKTADVEKKRLDLIQDGYDVTEMISPMPNVKFFFVKSPAGVTIQFM